MARGRNLRLPSSSDEDEAPPNPNPPSPPTSLPPSPPQEISDGEDPVFNDVPDDFVAPNPNPNLNPIVEILERFGLKLRREWIETCVNELVRAGLWFDRLDLNGKAKLCFEQALFHDFNFCGAGVLPENVGGMHNVELPGPFVLQVDEVVNISTHLKKRYHKAYAGCKRCLKLSLTDGVQRVFGMEYRPIGNLYRPKFQANEEKVDVTGPAGFKVVVRNVHIRRGLLMLVPEILEILGGMVEDLEAARQRLVDEIEKPPRGKRKRGNVTLALGTRASLAAWSSATVENASRELNISAPQSSNNTHQTAQAATFTSSRITTEASVIQEFHGPNISGNTAVEVAAQASDENNTIAPDINDHIMEENISTGRREATASTFVSRPIYETSTVKKHVIKQLEESTINESVAYVRESDSEIDIQTPPHVDETNVMDVDEVDEAEHPVILVGDREIPFTYLASMLAKWATREDTTSSIQGKIKCTLTGVKGFQFKNRKTYELHVYLDDGSLISEVIIDHHVVENCIGYSPEEVTEALSSSNKQAVTDMKETMKKFQLFLKKFEGIILVEINENFSSPVVLEMNQGCSISDAWMLLQRLTKFTALQNSSRGHSSTIDLSP